MDTKNDDHKHKELDGSDVVFRSLATLAIVFLLTVIAFLITTVTGIPTIGKDLADWIIAGATISYVIVSYLMFLAIRAQIVLSRDTSQQQLRAYVVVKNVRVEYSPVQHPAPPGTFKVIPGVTFLNAGQTPARQLEFFQNLNVGPLVWRPAFDKAPRAWRTIAVLGPGIEHPNNLRLATTIEPGNNTQLHNGKIAVYFWGAIKYRDIFGNSWTTPFAFRWPRIPGAVNDPDCIACEDGNDPE